MFSNVKTKLWNIITVFVVFVICMVPLWVRNYYMCDKFVLLTNQFGICLWQSHRDNWNDRPHLIPSDYYNVDKYKTMALDWIKKNKSETVISFISQCWYFWNPLPRIKDNIKWILFMFDFPLIFIAWKKAKGFPLIFMIAITLSHALFSCVGRYRVPIMFMLMGIVFDKKT